MKIFYCEACGKATCTIITTIPDALVNADGTCDDLPCMMTRTTGYMPEWRRMWGA